jgi:hypothetical protein
MSKYMSQIPPEPKPTAGPRVINKPFKGPKMDRDLRDKREMPKRKPKAKPVGPNLGIMGPEPKKKEMVKQRMLDDMRKRGMLRKAGKKKM